MQTFQTTFGPVPVRGDFKRFDASRTLVMVIRGAFPDPDSMTLLQDRFPEADFVIVDLPGMHAPFFANPSIGAFAAAYDEVLAELDRKQVITLGISTGALATFGMRQANRLIAVEPPLSSAAAWPLIPTFRERALESPDLGRWMAAIFGIYPDRVENRDYMGLAIESAPGLVMVGSEPLEPMRPFDRMPSLVAARDRAKLVATRHLAVMTIPGAGHNIPVMSPLAILSALRRTFDQLSAPDLHSNGLPT